MSDRNVAVPDGHPLQCSRPGCCTKRRVTVPVSLCAMHRQQLVRGTLILDGVVNPDLMLLPEDGVLDTMAVEIAAKGYRLVKLTYRERLLAAALIMEGDWAIPVGEVIRERLGVPRSIAWRLIDQVREAGIDVSGVLFYDADVNNQVSQEAS